MENGEYEFLKEKVVEYVQNKVDTGKDKISPKEFYLFAGLTEEQIGEHGYYNTFTWGALLSHAMREVYHTKF